MVSFREHHSYLVLGTFQACTILGGSLLTAAFMKYRENTGSDAWWYGRFSEGLLTYTRFWGFTFLLIPIIWVVASIWFERRHTQFPARTISLFLGSLILIASVIVFYHLVSIAASPEIVSPVRA